MVKTHIGVPKMGKKLPGLPPIPDVSKLSEQNAEDWEEEELLYPYEIVDRTKLVIRDAYPNFIITELQIFYYQSMYDQITAKGTVIESVDAYGLGMLAFNLATIDDCNRSIANKGMNIEYRGDRKMVLKRNPSLDVLKDAQAAVRFYLKEFNMTPTSRGKVLNPNPGQGEGSDGFDKV